MHHKLLTQQSLPYLNLPFCTSNSHPDAFVILFGTSAMLCNVLTPSTEVWRAKSTLFLLHSPVRSVSVTGSASIAHMQVSNPSYAVYTIYA